MSTSEALFDGRFGKRLVTVCGLVPAALLVWDAYHDQLGVNHDPCPQPLLWLRPSPSFSR